MKITDNVYALESTKGAYAYIILGKNITLIDTGYSWVGKRILRELEIMKVNLKDIKNILLTHYDLDHIGNATMLQKLTGAKLWASKEDAPYIVGQKPRPGFKKYLPYIFRLEKPSKLSIYNEEQIEDLKIEVISTPGHTPGHVCFLFEDVLFVGDLIKSKKGQLIAYPSNWNWNTAMLKESIKKLNPYSFKWICPAHGKPIERGTLWEGIK